MIKRAFNLLWSDFKIQVDNRNLSPQFVDDDDNFYEVYAIDGDVYPIRTLIKKTTPKNSDQIDFEDNYIPISNKAFGRGKYNLNGELEVSATVTVNPTENPGCPVLSNKAIINTSTSGISFGTSFTTIYNYLGNGKLDNFILRLNTEKASIKLTVDENQIFNINIETFKELLSEEDKSNGKSWVSFDDGKKRFMFHPNCPIFYTTSILIEAKSDDQSKEVYDYLVCLTKEV